MGIELEAPHAEFTVKSQFSTIMFGVFSTHHSGVQVHPELKALSKSC